MEKKKKIIIGIIFVVLIIGLGFYLYKNKGVKELSRETDQELKEMIDNIGNEDTKKIKSKLNDKYTYEYSGGKLYSVLENNNNIYSNNNGFNYSNIYIGEDDNIYVINSNLSYEPEKHNGYLEVYKLSNNNLNLVFKKDVNNDFFSNIMTISNDNNSFKESLIGFTMHNTNRIIKLDGTELEYSIISDVQQLAIDQDFEVYNNSYIAIKNNDGKVGLLDLNTNKQTIDYIYDDIITTKDKAFIAKKNNKYGLINETGQEIIPIEYDFVDYYGHYSVLGKDKKFAIMEAYKFLTDFIFEYDTHIYRPCCGNHSTFEVFKTNNNYIVITYKESKEDRSPIDIKMYTIKEDGSYKENNDVNNYSVEENKLHVTYKNTTTEEVFDIE